MSRLGSGCNGGLGPSGCGAAGRGKRRRYGGASGIRGLQCYRSDGWGTPVSQGRRGWGKLLISGGLRGRRCASQGRVLARSRRACGQGAPRRALGEPLAAPPHRAGPRARHLRALAGDSPGQRAPDARAPVTPPDARSPTPRPRRRISLRIGRTPQGPPPSKSRSCALVAAQPIGAALAAERKPRAPEAAVGAGSVAR